MHIKERVPRVLAAVAGTARAMRRRKPLGIALVVVAPLLTGIGLELFFLNLLGLGIGALFVRRRRQEREHRLWLDRRAQREEWEHQRWLRRREREAEQTTG